jgi:hypothetical protein
MKFDDIAGTDAFVQGAQIFNDWYKKATRMIINAYSCNLPNFSPISDV